MPIRSKAKTAMTVLRSHGLSGLARLIRDRSTASLDLRAVNQEGEGVVNLIDVGSVGGLPPEWRRHAPKIRTLLNFEPRDTTARSGNVTTMNTALWRENCERDFYIYRGLGGSGSSLFVQNREYVAEHFESLRYRGPSHLAETWFERSELVRTERIRCRMLDEVVTECCPAVNFHFLKSDTQGAEFEILAGADEVLATCVGLKLELFTIPLYRGISLLPEVADMLASKGFNLVRKFPPHGTFDSQHDCLFWRNGGDPAATHIIRAVYDL